MAKTFGATSTTDEVLEGVNFSRQARAGDWRFGRARRRDGARPWRRTALTSSAPRAISRRRNAATVQVREEARNGGGLELIELDLASLESVRAAADKLVAEGKPFDIIIANAGVMARRQGNNRRRLRDPVRHQPPRATSSSSTASRRCSRQAGGL